MLLALSQPYIYMQQKEKVAIPDPLRGKWETIHNPMEASVLSLEFKPNKKFSYSLSSTWHGTYKLEGTKLVSSLYIPIYKKYKADTTTILIFSDTLVQVGKERGEEKTTRMVKAIDSVNTGAGIIGTWIIDNQDNEYSTVTYTTVGTFEIKNILKSFNGSYDTKKDTLMAFSEGRMMFKNRFILDKGQLRLYSPAQSGPMTFEKVGK
jgi:hypothetical protein